KPTPAMVHSIVAAVQFSFQTAMPLISSSMNAIVMPNLRKSRIVAVSALIKDKLLPPVSIILKHGLLTFIQYTIAQNQIIHLCTHEAAIGILQSTDNRLTPHVKGRVHQHCAAGLLLK